MARAKRTRVDDWTDVYFKRTWEFAARVANHDHDRWTRLSASWDPFSHDLRPAFRRHGGQKKLWHDDIVSYLHDVADTDNDSKWWVLAQNLPWWKTSEEGFLDYMRRFLHSGNYNE